VDQDATYGSRRPVAGVLLIREARVLMLQRPDGVWAPPGGVVQDGESPLEGAIREAREETGFILFPAPFEHLYDFGWDSEPSMHVFQYISWAPAGEAVVSHEHVAAAWFELDEYVALQLSPPQHRALQLPPSSLQWLAEMRRVVERAKAWIAQASGTEPRPETRQPTVYNEPHLERVCPVIDLSQRL
jgi:8-oxo-dGTP diphosphatase